MHIVRRGLLIIIMPIFSFLLFATAFDWGIVKTVGQPTAVKQIVSESGIYDSLIPNLLSKIKQVDTGVGGLPAKDPVVAAAANQAFSPSYIQKNSETIIDSVYAWLDGKTAEPSFSLDLSAAKNNFADSLAAQYQQKAAGLPRCTTPYTATGFDIANATCLPTGVTPEAIAQSIKTDVGGAKGFIENPIISAASVKNNNSNQSIFQGQLKNFPEHYQRVKKTPAILIILTLLTAAAIFFISPTHTKGLRRVGIALLSVGLIMLVFAWALNKGVSTQVVPKITIKDNSVLTDKVRVLVTDITQRVDKNYWVFGGIYTLAGAAAVIAPAVAVRRRGGPTATSAPETSSNNEDAAPKIAPAPSPKTKRPRKIQ